MPSCAHGAYRRRTRLFPIVDIQRHRSVRPTGLKFTTQALNPEKFVNVSADPPPERRPDLIIKLTDWCGREDSNFHVLSDTTTSTLRVYQFRHDRTRNNSPDGPALARPLPLAEGLWTRNRRYERPPTKLSFNSRAPLGTSTSAELNSADAPGCNVRVGGVMIQL